MTGFVESHWRGVLSALDARLQPIARRPVDVNAPDWRQRLERTHPLDEAGVRQEAQDALHALVAHYQRHPEEIRATIRALLQEHRSFAWATSLRCGRQTPEGLKAHLVHYSMRDQGRDPRDAQLWLDAILADARAAGLDPAPALREVAALSSQEDHFSWGSTRALLEARLPR